MTTESFEKMVVVGFIDEHWDLFCEFCHEAKGLYEESEVDEVFEKLEKSTWL